MRSMLSLCALSVLSSCVIAADVHVPGDFATIQAAVNAANDGDSILVAPGTYAERVTAPLNISIEIIGVDGPSVTILDARGAPGQGSALKLIGGDDLVKGLTIRGDEGEVSGLNVSGAGIFKSSGSMTIEDCVIEECVLTNSPIIEITEGAGARLTSLSTLVIRDTVFRNNGPSFKGGAISAFASTTELIGCRFENNSATSGGAVWYAMINMIQSCDFVGNHATDSGGALFGSDIALIQDSVLDSNTSDGGNGAINGSLSQIFNCVFSNNIANGEGGAIGQGLSPDACRVDSSLFYNNSAASGSCIDSRTPIEINNSILWNNDPSTINADGAIVVRYSIVEGGFPGDGNFDADPMFVDPINGDFNLATGSPAIDAGNNALLPRDLDDLNNNGIITDGYPFDMVGNPRHTQDLFVPDTGVADMLSFPLDLGPLERVLSAPTDGFADCNGNFINDLLDILGDAETDLNENLIPDSCDIASGVLTDEDGNGIPDEYETCTADLNGDGVLNFFDVSVFLSAYQAGCP